jgi:ADP-glucose pyrophosphorylase
MMVFVRVLSSNVFDSPGGWMVYFHYQVRFLSAKKRGTIAFPTVKNSEASAFGNVQIASSNLEKFEEKMDHFLHARKEEFFIRCEAFNTCGCDLCR